MQSLQSCESQGSCNWLRAKAMADQKPGLDRPDDCLKRMSKDFRKAGMAVELHALSIADSRFGE